MDNGLDNVPNPTNPPESAGDTPETIQEEAKFSKGNLLGIEEKNERERKERQRDKLFSLRMRALGVASTLVLLFGVIFFLVGGYLIILWLVHSTTTWGWLSVEQQAGLANVYSSVSGVAFPILMMANGWLIWRASRTHERDRR